MFRTLLLLLLPLGLTAQVSLKGKLIDKESKVPLEAATVYLTSVKDSTTIDYTITSKSGEFTIGTQKLSQPFYLKTSYVGYQDFVRKFESLNEAVDLGTIEAEEAGNTIDEVIVKAEAPPVRVKSDTLEFNASSFKIRPDANVETLLKQLPGVDIDSDGKITVNGKEVNQILVNGKPFFDKDGKVALQNLPSDIINKVQVTDTKTKKEEVTGEKASSNNASINLTIDEDKNKGFFGKVMGGYGSDDRYESSLMLNYFKDKRKISVIGSMNNINSTGFTMNEIFDSMGGGRNYSVWTNDDGSFGINGMRFGGGAGITRSGLLGLNYADEFAKDFTTTGNYFYNSAHTENANRSRIQTLLPEGTFVSESRRDVVDERFAHNAGIEFEFKPDSLTTITYNPKFVKGRSWSDSNSSERTINENGRIARESDGLSDSESTNQGWNNSLNIGRGFKRKGRYLNLWMQSDNNRSESSNRNVSNNSFYFDNDNDGITDETQTDNRNQIRRDRNVSDNFYGEIEWSEPLQDSLSLRIKMEFDRDHDVSDRTAFDFNGVSESYDLANDLLTNYMTSSTLKYNPQAGIGIRKSKLNLSVNLGTALYKFNAKSDYLGVTTRLRQEEIYPSANVWGGYNFTKSKSMWVNYSFDVNFPSAGQLLPVEDLSNPLNTISGNPDLSPNKQHYMYLSFRDYDYASKSGYSFYGGGQIYESSVTASTVYDDSRKGFTTYENVSGNHNMWGGGNWSKTIKREAHSYRFSVGLNGNFNRTQGFVNGELFDSNSVSFTPAVNFTYSYGDLLTINPQYRFTNSTTRYDNYIIDEAFNVTHRGTLQVTSYWPKHFVIGTDLSYTYNSNIADGFKKDFYLLNVSLGYNFLGDKFLAKVKVYDVLDQNQNTTRSIGATTITDQQNTVLKRYLMFSLTYKLTKFGGKEKKESSHFWWQ